MKSIAFDTKGPIPVGVTPPQIPGGSPPKPDLAAIKQRQQETWATGDFSVVAARVLYPAEMLLETADPHAGARSLDVATGSGNAAIAAARRGCIATGIDYVPALLERGRLRAAAEHLEVSFIEADAERLPFPDASFDLVTSIYGVMFAPSHRTAANELLRVTRPGGKIALASWTPGGSIGEMFRMTSRYLPPPAGLTPPTKWGDEQYLRELFGEQVTSVTSEVRQAIFRYPTVETYVEFFRTWFGPTIKTFEALPAERHPALIADMSGLARKYNRNAEGGPIAVVGEYLESILVRA
jgi:ubiquinone/menaquinone biosynthesis C-methylase UbiE